MITVFLPCRKGSQRIPDKNIKTFSGIKGGLLKIKLDSLMLCNDVDEVVVSSNDERVLNFSASYKNSKIRVVERAEHLGLNTTTTDELINYVPSVIKEGDVLWTHVTSPFLIAQDYSEVIDSYKEKMNYGYDSLMTVLKIQGFIWNKSGPLNYDKKVRKWPMTQDIEELYEINSGIFLSTLDNYKIYLDRIGTNPFLYKQDKMKSIDIDWPEDFHFAEQIWQQLQKAK